MKKTTKRLGALLLALAMVLSLVPMTALVARVDDTEVAIEAPEDTSKAATSALPEGAELMAVAELTPIEGTSLIPLDEMTPSGPTPYGGEEYPKLKDNDSSTHYGSTASFSNENDRYVQIELSNVEWLAGLHWMNRGANNGAVTKYAILFSMDGHNWSPIADNRNGEAWVKTANTWNTVTFDYPIQAKYVKVLGVETHANYISCAELRLAKPDTIPTTADTTITVTDSSTSAPIVDATVVVAGQAVTTGANGQATVQLIQSQTYPATVTATDHAPGTVSVTGGANTAVTLDGLVGTISGTVSTSGGQPVEGATVSLTRANASYTVVTGLTATTDANGRYSFTDLSSLDAGDYHVRASKDGSGAVINDADTISVDSQHRAGNIQYNVTLDPIDTSNATYTYDMTDADEKRPSLGLVKKDDGTTPYVDVTWPDDNKMKLSFKEDSIDGVNNGDENTTRDHNVVTLLGTNMKTGIIEFDATREGTYKNSNNPGRFGLLFRLKSFDTAWIFVGQWNNDVQWSREYRGADGKNWTDNSDHVVDMPGPSFTMGDTRHFKVTVGNSENDNALKVEIDGLTVINTTDMVSDSKAVPTEAMDVAFVCGNDKPGYGLPSDITIDNLYITRTDPDATITLTQPSTGTLAAQRVTSAGNGPLVGEDSNKAFAGDPIKVTPSGLTDGYVLDGLTITKADDTVLTDEEKDALNIETVCTAEENYCTFEMPAYNIKVAGVVLPVLTEVEITAPDGLKVNKTVTAQAKVGSDSPNTGVNYKWYHQNTEEDGTTQWIGCTEGEAATKTIKGEDLNKRIKVVATGDGTTYASTVSVEKVSDAAVAAADTPLESVNIQRTVVNMVANGAESDDNTSANVGKTTILTASISPDNATSPTCTWKIFDAATGGNDITSSTNVIALATVDGHSNQQKVTANNVGTVWVQVEVDAAELAQNAVTTDRVEIVVTNELKSITVKNGENVVNVNDKIIIYANAANELTGQTGKVNTVTLAAERNPSDNTNALTWEVSTRPNGLTEGGIQVVRNDQNTLQATVSFPTRADGSVQSEDFVGKLGEYKVKVKSGSVEKEVTFELRRFVNRNISMTITEAQDQNVAPKYGQHLKADIQSLAMSEAGKAALKFEWFALDAESGNAPTEIPSSAQPFKTETATEGSDSNGRTIVLDNTGLADGLNLVGKYIAVKITATPGGTNFYEGSKVAIRAQAVAKADGPAITADIHGVKATAADDSGGTITGFPTDDGNSYEYQAKNGSSWTPVNGASEVTVAAGTYVVRIKETATHNAGAEKEVEVPTYASDNHRVIIGSMTGGTVTTSPAQADPNATITLTIKPNTGYELATITVTKADNSQITLTDGAEDADGNATKTFTMPEVDVTVNATFRKITLRIDHSGLTNIKCSEDTGDTHPTYHEVEYGTQAAIKLVPNTGYTLPAKDQIHVQNTDKTPVEDIGGWEISNDGTITFPVVDGVGGVIHNLKIVAVGVPNSYTVTRDISEALSLTAATDRATYGQDYTATLSVVTAQQENYELPDTVTVKRGDTTLTLNTDYEYSKSSGTITVKAAAVTGNLTISATAKQKVKTVTAATISGSAMVGQQLTVASVTPNVAVTYQWQRADAENGSFADIADATSSTYALTTNDQGKYIRVLVTAVAPNEGENIPSNVLGPVAAQVIAAESVTVTAPQGSDNKVTFGQTLQLTATIAPNTSTETQVKWSVVTGGEEVVAVNADTGVVTPKKVGTATIRATVLHADGTDGVTNTLAITVEAAPFTVSLSGIVREGETLTLTTNPSDLVLRNHTWYRVDAEDGTETQIQGATGTTYTPTTSDVGYKIKVTVSEPSDTNYTGSASFTTNTAVLAIGEQPTTHTVTFTLNGAALEITSGQTVANNAVTVDDNATLTFKLTVADDTKEVKSVKVDNTSITPAESVYTIANITADKAVVVEVGNKGGTPPTVDTTALETAITAAKAAKNGVQVIDGQTEAEVNRGTKFVTTEVMTALNTAITTAETAKDASDKTQASVDAAVTALNTAVETFRAAVKTGTKATGSSTTSRPSTSTETTTNPDGSKTTTVTDNRTGTVTETTEKADGTKEVVETKKDGTVTETVTAPDGAKTEKVTDPEENVTITVTDPEGEELAKVELPAEIPATEARFDDVPEGHWADKAIQNTAALKLVEGTGDNKYEPVAPMTRGALATVLHRFSQGKTNYNVTFKDVAEGQFYTEGVAWAARAGVVKGYNPDIFAPDQIITREQLAVMLARYAKLIGLDTQVDETALDQFADGDATGTWAEDGVAWCVKSGILQGKGGSVLDPTANVSRAEAAVMLDRFVALIK